MSDLVDKSRIEDIVGVRRMKVVHVARAVSEEETVYILHSKNCLESTADLRDCKYSLALDEGIDPFWWDDCMDIPVMVTLVDGQLVPSGLQVTFQDD